MSLRRQPGMLYPENARTSIGFPQDTIFKTDIRTTLSESGGVVCVRYR